ncbi:TPA: DUF423 domain-containing protein [Vibrio parahaemolyticus]|uniref:DUF423 domain-containing protein n=1 Tax=Vibrio parahaemolyticus TaxID=670 RepID=UPI001E56B861|nr:DUF423 domain-containing protein [Vibrio parahaemolyticus]MCG6451252.1 DUF423 domain-containing protein [Vibrio parahaemolyticus]
MERLLPASFIEALGASLIALAMLFAALSLFPKLRIHSLKLLALLFVAGLCLFSNNTTTYFAALFIIATAVTELEFLQNLAAIIRGNKEYFTYKIEALSSEEKQEKIAKEQHIDLSSLKESDKETISKEHIRAKTKRTIERAYESEEKALNYLEKYFGSVIQRNVRVKTNRGHIELDGLITNATNGISSDKIIEIKYISNPLNLNHLYKSFKMTEHKVESYRDLTNKLAQMHWVLVIEGSEGLNEVQTEKLKSMIDNSPFSGGYSILTTKQLGM